MKPMLIFRRKKSWDECNLEASSVFVKKQCLHPIKKGLSQIRAKEKIKKSLYKPEMSSTS